MEWPLDKERFKIKIVYYWECACNVFVAILWIKFLYVYSWGFVAAPRLSSFLLAFKNSLLAIFYLTRRCPKTVTFSFYPWLVAVCGTCAPFLLRPTGADFEDYFVYQLIMLIGHLIGLHAHLALNRSFGIVPANRGIVSSGPYKYIRHPIYTGYLITSTGYILNQPSELNLYVYLICAVLNMLRILEEEKLLLKDEQYREFAAKTRWRMLPYIF